MIFRRGVILEDDAVGTSVRYSPGVDAVRRVWAGLLGLEPRLLDGLMAIALGVGAGVQLLSEEPGEVARLLPAIGTCLPLVIRRRYPLICHALQVACAALTRRQPVTISSLAIFIGVYSVAVYSPWRRFYPIWLVIGAAIIVILFPESSLSVPSWVSLLVAGFGLWLVGSAMRDRQQRGDMLEERALRLERERELSMRVAVADERQRIARELHDVVAHSVSVMVVQAGAARTVLNRQPERAAEALLAVEGSGREALSELRRLLGLLTDADSEPALSPQPGLDQLDRLVQRVTQAGLRVDVRIDGIPRPLPPGLDLTAYRIIQEALTNALKYAGGARTEVRVGYEECELRLTVLDSGGPVSNGTAGAGRGLMGMHERVAVYGGELEAGRRPEGGFAVRARLPLEPL
jgi:signal transduction histidine kinase